MTNWIADHQAANLRREIGPELDDYLTELLKLIALTGEVPGEIGKEV